jgi:hypothetical protein
MMALLEGLRVFCYGGVQFDQKVTTPCAGDVTAAFSIFTFATLFRILQTAT